MAHRRFRAEAKLVYPLAQTIVRQNLDRVIVLEVAEWLHANGSTRQHQKLVATLIDNGGNNGAANQKCHDHA